MIAGIHGDIFLEPCRGKKGIRGVFGGEFHFRNDERAEGIIKDVQLNF